MKKFENTMSKEELTEFLNKKFEYVDALEFYTDQISDDTKELGQKVSTLEKMQNACLSRILDLNCFESSTNKHIIALYVSVFVLIVLNIIQFLRG